jgi:hypothetical protein
MSTNNNNSILVKNVPHTNRFLNASLSHLNSSNMINLQNTNSSSNSNMNAAGGGGGGNGLNQSNNTNNTRRLPKAINISSNLTSNGLSSNSSFNSYQYTNSMATNAATNITNNTSSFNNASQAYFPSMIKGNVPSFNANNKKYSNDYQQAGKKLFKIFNYNIFYNIVWLLILI